jgi:photosystem II stability/assembly factor-like uncharacterized protein
MSDGQTIDDALRDASRELDRAATAAARAAPSTEELRRVHRRAVHRRRTITAGATLAAVAGVIVVGSMLSTSGPTLVLDTPPATGAPQATADAQRARDDGATTDPGSTGTGTDAGDGDGDGAPDGSGAWLEELARLVEDGRQVPTGAAVTEDGRIAVVGVTIDGPADGLSRPVAWIVEAGGSWRRSGELPVDTATPGDGRDAFVNGVALGRRQRLVAVGYTADTAADGQPLAWLSEDGGRTWDVTAISERRGSAQAVTWTGEMFVAVGATDAGAMLWVSPDGRSWTEQASAREGILAPEGILVAVVAHRRTLVLVEQTGDASRLLVAELAGAELGGLRVAGSFAGSLTRLAADRDSGALYAAGSQRPNGLEPAPLLLTSSDGLSWEEQAMGWDAGDEQPAGLHDVVVDGGQVVSAGTVNQRPLLSSHTGSGQAHILDLPADVHGTVRLAHSPDGVLVLGMIESSDGQADIAVWRWNPRPTGS